MGETHEEMYHVLEEVVPRTYMHLGDQLRGVVALNQRKLLEALSLIRITK